MNEKQMKRLRKKVKNPPARFAELEKKMLDEKITNNELLEFYHLSAKMVRSCR